MTIQEGSNISIEQSGSTMTISSTGGGTTDYSNLSNKPKINSVELNGNKSLSDLGAQETLVSGTNIKTINNNSLLGSGNITIQGGGGTSDYSDLTNKPSINNVTLSGNKTSSDLGLQPAGNYITKAVNDLENYYKKTETFTKQEVNDLISAITTIDIQVVQTLPTQDISTTTIYLVPKTTAETNDAYDEYIYVSNAWEHIGSTEVDLTNYVTNTDYASNSTGGVVKTNTNYGTSVDSNGSLRGTTKTYEDYGSMHNLGLISKVTLENVIAGKGLVANTDYATSSRAGLIKTASSAATDTVTSNGTLYARNLNYATYSSASDNAFIGKGTLENVITGKGLIDNTYHDSSKQDTLISGTNIKTINNNSLLGSGNITVPQVVDQYSTSTTNSYSANYVNRIGKLLWEGTFISGSISVPGISDYIVVAMDVGGVICVGNQEYGGCSFTRYGSLDIDTYAYRFTYNTSNETLTIDNISKGGTNGTISQAIYKIYGIF